MEDMFKKIDELLEKPLYVIDFLPQRVPKTSNGNILMLKTICLMAKKT